MGLRTYLGVGTLLKRFIYAGAVGVFLFSLSASVSFAAGLSVAPQTVRPNDQFTLSIDGPANSFVCVVDQGDTCVDAASFIALGPTGKGQIIKNIPSNQPPGSFTFTAHFYSNRNITTEITELISSATITIADSATTPPAGTKEAPSDLDCPLGLPKDKSTGLCLPTNPLTPATGSIVASSSVGQLIQRFLDILLTLAGVIAILFIVIGGYQYITSRGAEDQAKAGRKTMTYAIFGLIAILLAYTAVNLVVRLITTGTIFG